MAGEKQEYGIWKNPHIERKWLFLKRYYAMNVSVYEMEPHAHPEIEIMYVSYGECEIICLEADGSQSRYRMKKDEYVMIEAGRFHALFVERGGSCRILNMELGMEAAEGRFTLGALVGQSDFLRQFLGRERDYLFLQDKSGEMLFLINHIQHYEKSAEDKKEGHIMQNFYLAQLMLLMSRHAAERKEGNKGNLYIRKTKEFLENHYDDDVSIARIAQNAGVSEAYLQRIYKQEEGESIMTALNRLRIQKACVLLINSRLPVIDVAVSVGFHSRQHFAHVFTKGQGCTPADYRKKKGNLQLYEGFRSSRPSAP